MLLSPNNSARPTWSSREPWSPSPTTPHAPGAFPSSPTPNSYASDPNQANPSLTSVSAVLKSRKDEYVRKKHIRIKVGSWNVASMNDASKDLGGWFVEGRGMKGLNSSTSVSSHKSESENEDVYLDTDTEIETVEEQEARRRRRQETLPKNDSAGLASGDDVDLYVLGLQEVIDVSSVTEAMKPYTDPNPARRWKSAIRKKLPRGYKKVVEHQLIGLLLLVFASPELAPEISSVDSTSVGTGLMGYLGNKGAVSARILVGESTRLLFVNCHLAAGADANALARRIWDTQQIVNRTKFAPVGDEWVGGVGTTESIGDEDFAFWFGDLNYRLDDIPGEDVRRLLLLHARNEYDVLNRSKRRIDTELGYIDADQRPEDPTSRYEMPDEERPATTSNAEPPLNPEDDPASLYTTLKSLLTHDQLYAQQRAMKAFSEGWKEGEINFLPTYKYDVGSVAMFDSGEKKRSPSWCDRILYRTRHDYECYQQRAKEAAEAKKRDEEMKKSGVDDATSQEDVLFDYDPDEDGDEDDDDENRGQGLKSSSSPSSTEIVQTKEGFEDALRLEDYASHQRVLSSDHKPLSAVFSLHYDSVDRNLKSKVQHQITRDFDRAENEARPSVTLVLENHSRYTSVADRSSDNSDLKIADFGQIRYKVLYDHHITIANTGQIEVNFAFIGRPGSDEQISKSRLFPDWLTVYVQQDEANPKVRPSELEIGPHYILPPGETTSISLTVCITDAQMVKELNSGELMLDDVLVLRVASGRDYFIPVKGTWLQTCFYRSVEELVRVPSGVRSMTSIKAGVESQHKPTDTIVHSAPQELFTLTDMIPPLVERVAADWDMLSPNDDPPWQSDQAQPWPFGGADNQVEAESRTERLIAVREALDKAEAIDLHLDQNVDHLEKLELISETLIDFLNSLTDVLITIPIWNSIESRIQAYEKSNATLTDDTLQEIAMEAISTTPVHSVSVTFVTFMITQIIQELVAEDVHASTGPSGRSRSSTSASAMSNVSLSSVKSNDSSKTKGSFLPSLIKRTTNLSLISSQPAPSEDDVDEKALLRHRYAEVFAPIIIRSDSSKLKDKERRTQIARKVRTLEALLTT